MTLETARKLLNAYIDGELDAASTIELESELEASPALRQELERLSLLHHLLQAHVTRFDAAPGLRKSLLPGVSDAQTKSIPPGVSPWWRTVAVGAAAATLALLFLSLGSTFPSRNTNDILIDETVSAHIRSLMGDHLTDLASSERHSVKPWLSNRLDFSPPVHDFANEGFILTGARLDYISGKPAAAIVYRYRQHVINVFVQLGRPTGDHSFEFSNHRGYNSVTVQSNGMTYRAVSDLNREELGHLAKLLQEQSMK